MQKIKDNLSLLAEECFGATPIEIKQLWGDGSDRKIFRIFYDDESYIGVYGLNPAENNAFISFSNHFKNYNLPVPNIFAFERRLGIYVETDFGDISLRDYIIGPAKSHVTLPQLREIYTKILENLLDFQLVAGQSIDFDRCYQSKVFDFRAMMQDLLYFKSSYLDRFSRSTYDEQKLLSEFQSLAEHLSSVSAVFFLYRDFQSKNIMIHDDEPFYLDYQSGRMGALQYDVASLLFDANVDLPDDFRDTMLHSYLSKLSAYNVISSDEFVRTFYDFALLRLLQALAAFSFLSYQKGKMQFAECIPQALKNIDVILYQKALTIKVPQLKRIFDKAFCIHESLKS